MRRTSFLFVLLILVLSGSTPSSPVTYEIDPGHTFITFKVERFQMVDVVSRFNGVSGHITLDEDHLENTSAEVVIETASYDSWFDPREKAVKGPAFLDVANYPEITFETKRIEPGGEQHVAVGDLTIHGVTREVSFPFTLRGPRPDPTGLTTIALSGGLTIDRQDFGITFDKKLPNGEPLIGNEVEIELNVLAVQAEQE